jgi:PAS domain S-box-containing protein
MKDDTSTQTPDGTAPNEFEREKLGTADRSRAEAAIEELRRLGGVFVNAVRATRMPMVLTDPNLPGNPIVFANQAFLGLSGYSMEEVLGQEPHFMNGPLTDTKDAARFAEAVRADQDDIIETIQYRKDGSRFVATVLTSAFKSDDGRTLNHFMSWLDVTRRVDAEDDLHDVQATLREELANTRILQELGARFISEDDTQTIYEAILTAAIEISGAKAGTVQVLDPATEKLVLLATRGFSQRTRDYFRRVDARSHTSCGLALRTGDRAYVSYDPNHPDMSAQLHVSDGLLSAQSSPLLSRSGRPIGMVSTHWSDPGHRLSEPEARSLDLLIRQAADVLEQRESSEALRESERHSQALLAELQHRVRNTLAVVRSIARRTAERSTDLDEMIAHFEGRLNAFSRVQSAITRSPETGVELNAIVEDELLAVAAREGKQLKIKGPDIYFQSRPAEALSLAIHELATNAVKYGALSVESGRIRVQWKRVTDGDTEYLDFEWVESGLPVEPSAGREGFGHEMLKRSLAYDLGAKTEIQFKRDGLRFVMHLPLTGIVLAEGIAE